MPKNRKRSSSSVRFTEDELLILLDLQDSLNKIIDHQLLLQAAYKLLDDMYPISNENCKAHLNQVFYFFDQYRDHEISESLRKAISELNIVVRSQKLSSDK